MHALLHVHTCTCAQSWYPTPYHMHSCMYGCHTKGNTTHLTRPLITDIIGCVTGCKFVTLDIIHSTSHPSLQAKEWMGFTRPLATMHCSVDLSPQTLHISLLCNTIWVVRFLCDWVSYQPYNEASSSLPASKTSKRLPYSEAELRYQNQ